MFDDGMGASWPIKTRFDARRAILISTRLAKLQSAQGNPFNTDFTDNIKYVKVVPCVEASAQQQAT